MVSLFSFGKKSEEAPLPRSGEGDEPSLIPGFPFETAVGATASDPASVAEAGVMQGAEIDELKALREEFDTAVKQALDAFHRYVAAVGQKTAAPAIAAPVANEAPVVEAPVAEVSTEPTVLDPSVAERLNASLAAAFGSMAPVSAAPEIPVSPPAPVFSAIPVTSGFSDAPGLAPGSLPPTIQPPPVVPRPVSEPVNTSMPMAAPVAPEPVAAPVEVPRSPALSVPPPVHPPAQAPQPAQPWAASLPQTAPPTRPAAPAFTRMPDPVFTPPASIPPVLPVAAKAPVTERPAHPHLPPPVAPVPAAPAAPPAQLPSPFTIVNEGVARRPAPPAMMPAPAAPPHVSPPAPTPAPAPAAPPASLPFSPFQGLEPVPPPPPFMNSAGGEAAPHPSAGGPSFQPPGEPFGVENGRAPVLGTVIAGGSQASQQEFLGAMQATLATQRFEPSPTHAFPMPAHLESPFHSAFAPNGPVAPPAGLPPVVPPQPAPPARFGEVPGRRV